MLKNQAGSILIEGLVSVAIFAFGVLALIGMQSVAIKNASQAQYRNEAGQLANQILSQIMVDQANTANYDDDSSGSPAKDAWLTQVQNVLPNGTGSVAYVDTSTTPRQVTITLTWRSPGEEVGQEHQYVVTATAMPAVN